MKTQFKTKVILTDSHLISLLLGFVLGLYLLPILVAPTSFLDIKYEKFLSQESILSDNYLQDSIVVGDPYSKNLKQLHGTDQTFNKH